MFAETHSPATDPWDEERIQEMLDKIAANRPNPDNIVLTVLLSQSNTSSYNTNYLTRITFIPCLVATLLSSLLLILIIKRYLRDCLVLYFSVLVYAVCQVLLFLAILLDIILSSVSLSSLLFCKVRSSTELVVLVLSAYSILGMTVVRFIFIQKPLHYRSILRLRYQVSAVVVEVALSVVIAVSPLLGLCELEIEGERFCHYSTRGRSCWVFHVICIGVGIALPVVVTAVLYGVIYRSILRLKGSQRRFQPTISREKQHSQHTSSNSGNSNGTARTYSSAVSCQPEQTGPLVRTRSTDKGVAWSKDPLSMTTDPLTMTTDPLTMTTDPLSISTDPLGMATDPLNMATDPLGTSTDPLVQSRISQGCRKRSSSFALFGSGQRPPKLDLNTFGALVRTNTTLGDLVRTNTTLGALVNQHYEDTTSSRRRPSWARSPTLHFLNSPRADKVCKKLGSMIKESRQVPWSIMTVLVLYLVTTVPWVALITAPQLWYGSLSAHLRLLLDVKYSVMFLGIAASPVVTIVTTKALRKAFRRFINSLKE